MAGAQGSWKDLSKQIRLESWTGQSEPVRFCGSKRSARHTGKGMGPAGPSSCLNGEGNTVRVAKEPLWLVVGTAVSGWHLRAQQPCSFWGVGP